MKRIVVLGLFIFSFSLGKAQINDTLDFQNWNQISNNGVLEIDSMDAVWNEYQGMLITDTTWNGYPTNSDAYLYFHINVDSSILLGGGNANSNLIITHAIDMTYPSDFGKIQYESSGIWYDVNQSFNGSWYFEYDQNYFYPYYSNGNYFFSGYTGNEVESSIDISCVSLLNPDESNRSGNIIPLRFWFHSDNISETNWGWAILSIVFENFTGHCIGGIHENQNQLQLSVYPTLTDNKITFETESEKFSQISIYDFSGKLVEEFNFQPSNFKTLHLSNYSNGMYFYSVDNGKATGKFIKE